MDELWKFVNPPSLPVGLEKVARRGHAENLERLTATQPPRDYHRNLRAEVTERAGFSSDEPGDLGTGVRISAGWTGWRRCRATASSPATATAAREGV